MTEREAGGKCRPKTNSITHLVKIVAREVFEDKFDFLHRKVNRLERELNEVEMPLVPDDAFLKQLESDLENAGGPWFGKEDRELSVEVDTVIRFLAKRHGRSVGAISSRIRQKELIRG